MKAPSPSAGADSFIQYLNANSTILTDQGINVRAFINGLSALKSKAAPSSSPAAPKSKSRKK